MILKIIPLVVICLLFLLTRLYKIEQIPPSLYWDEASIGYNAYSILTTGADEWGSYFPVHFRAFGEFKLPIYIYAVALSEKLFGLNELGVRIPSVLFSLGSVIITFLLSYKLTSNLTSSYLSALFLTISPWYFIFSRSGYEAMAGLMFFLLGIYLFTFRKNIFIILSALCMILSLYSYNAFRILVPLTLILLIFYYLQVKDIQFKKHMPAFLLVLALIIFAYMPVIRLLKSDSGSSRLESVGIFNQEDKGATAKTFFLNLVSHLSFDFLFINGDKNVRSHVPGFGQLYVLQLPVILLGLYALIKDKKDKLILLCGVSILSFVPASITKEAPHALRSITAVPFISIISAIGISFFLSWIKVKNVLYILIGIFLMFFAYFYKSFIYDYPKISSSDWQLGYKIIFTRYNHEFNNYDKIVISDRYAQPYIFALFYLKYDPEKFRSGVIYNNVDRWGFSTVSSFGKFIFSPVNKNNLPEGKLLVFSAPGEKFDYINYIDQIKNLDGTTAFYVYKNNVD